MKEELPTPVILSPPWPAEGRQADEESLAPKKFFVAFSSSE